MNSKMYSTKFLLGLFGSSHVEQFPYETFNLLKDFKFTIKPIHISSSPKNIRAILRQDTVNKTIKHIQSNHIHLDYILILIGANDIGYLSPEKITQGIIYIADSFTNINIQPIIVPIFNRDAPSEIPVPLYDSHRNRINRQLRNHYKRQHLTRIISLNKLHLDGDGVHLTYSSYRVITKSIAYHIQKSIIYHFTQLPPGIHISETTGEEITVDFIYEEIH